MPKIFAVFFLLLFLVAPTSHADENNGVSETDVLRMMYGGFLGLESFGNVRVVFEGEDAEKIGLDSDELTGFLKLKYKNNFAGFPYNDINALEPGEFFEILRDEDRSSKLGVFIVTVWVVGTDYPIAYHIETTAGSFSDSFYENASLGFGSKDNVPNAVKKTISNMAEELAITFFKTRGEL